MKVVCIRHGNTFGPGDKIVWVGKGEDLPLVEKGFEQARRIAEVLRPVQERVGALYTGPLKRAAQTAEIISQECSLSESNTETDARLNEIDYGIWGGKSTEEIEALGYGEQLEHWNTVGAFPTDAGWSVTENDLLQGTKSFLEMLESSGHDIILVVTSNGLLRFMMRHVPEAYERHREAHTLKVRTGALCGLEYTEGEWKELFWNLLPEEAADQVAKL